MKNLIKAVAVVLASASLINCTGGTSASNPSTSSTMSISGTMSISNNASSLSTDMSTLAYMKNEAITAMAAVSGVGNGDGVASQTAACADGGYYRVLCSAWSVPPVSAYGDVACSGSTGGFTVSGLPKNTDITCAIRKSTDGTTFTAFANLELPASTISGSTDNINTSGDLAVTVDVNPSTGTATATVVSGTNSVGSPTTTVDVTAMSGFYSLTCPSDISAANTVACKCFLLADHSGGQDPGDCVAQNASGVTGTSMSVDFNIYEGVAGSSGVTDHDLVIPANGKLYAGTIWAAENSGNPCTSSTCTSARTGAGEGLPSITGLTWTNSAATAALTWSSTIQLDCPNSGDTGDGTVDGKVTVSVGTVPGVTANRAAWLAWYKAIVDAYAATGKCSAEWNGCSSSVAIEDRDDNPYCLGNFAWNVYDDAAESANVPKVRWDFSKTQTCTNSGCTGVNTASADMIMVDGVDFNEDGTVDHNQVSPRSRFVLDQFLPNSSGTGGSMKSGGFDIRYYGCGGMSPPVTCSAAAISANAGVECGVKRDLVIKWLPTGTAGQYNMVFDEKTSVAFGKYKGGSVNNTDAYSVCVEKEASEVQPSFMARGTKL